MKRLVLRSVVVALFLVLVAVTLIACSAPATSDSASGGGAATKGVYQNLDPNREYYLCSSH